jgi:hypothetical protein
MAFVYEVNGQRVEFEREPTEKDIDEAAASLKTTAPVTKEKTTLEKFTEPLKDISLQDWAKKSMLAPAMQTMSAVSPFGLLRPQMGVQNLQQGSSNLGNKLSEMGQGIYHAVTNPQETAQRAYNAITQNPAGVAGEMVKGAIYDPELAVGAVKPTVAAVKAPFQAATGVYNAGKGFARGIAYPEGTGANSALVPIRPTYTPHPEVEAFMKMTPEEQAQNVGKLSEVPTAPLYENNPVSNWAYGMAPENAQGLKLVPTQGRTMEGIGENLGSSMRKNPLQGAIDLAGMYTGIGPIATAIKSVPAASTALLRKATNFEPNFQAVRAQAEAMAANTPKAKSMQAAAEKITPEPQPQAPVVGPVNPATQPTPEPTGITPEFQQRMDAAGVKSPTVETPPPAPPPTPEPIPTTGPVEPKPLPTETLNVPTPKTEVGPVEEILKKTRQVTKEENKAQVKESKANEKAKFEGKEVKKEPIHPEVERITKESEQPTAEYIKSLELENKTPQEKQKIKETLINEERKIQSALRDNRITKALNNDEMEVLMKRYHAVNKAVNTIQNEQVRASSLATWEKNQAIIAERNANKSSKKKAPSNVSQMLSPEQELTYKSLKADKPRSEMTKTEGKIFDMTQAERDIYEGKMKEELSKAKYPMDKQLINTALKLIEKYRIK